MKICFLMPHHWTSTLGGAELQVRFIMDFMRRNTSHELAMICCHTKAQEEAGAPIYRSWPSLPIRRYSLASDGLSISRLLRMISPCVVYTRTSTPLVGFAARYCQRHGKTLVYHIAHQSDVEKPAERGRRALLNRIHRPIYEYGLRRADIIIAQAEYQREMLERNYGLTASAIVPNFHPEPSLQMKDGTMRTVLWVANLKRSKQPELFLDLVRRCSHIEDVRFVMVGAVIDLEYAELVQRMSDVTNFYYLGAQPIEEVQRQFALADVFVNTSKNEGFPNTFIQAWLNSVPVVSFEFDPDDMIAKHDLGSICKGSNERMSDIVEQLLADPVKRRLVGGKARAFAGERFGEANCRKLVDLIEQEVSAGQLR